MADEERNGIKKTIISNIGEATKNLAVSETMRKEDEKILLLTSIRDILKEENNLIP